MKNRIFYPKPFKRLAFIEVSKNKSLLNFLINNNYDLKKVLSNDKKYIAKLTHKWKKEFFEKRELLTVEYYQFNNQILQEEIMLMANDKEDDFTELKIW